jgi:hypothetical protein
MKLAQRDGMKKAKVALARKLAVILHRMLAGHSIQSRLKRYKAKGIG